MKFNDGYWLTKPEYEFHYASDTQVSRITEKELTILAPTKPIKSRGDVLNLPVLTYIYSSPMENVIRVSAIHHKGAQDPKANFEVSEDKLPLKIDRKKDLISLQSGALELEIDTSGSWNQTFLAKGKVLTSSNFRNAAYIRKKQFGNDRIGSERLPYRSENYMVEQLKLSPGETVYGLGERFTPFVKNGQTVDIWHEDGGTSSEQAYKNIPFYFTSRGYGVFINHPGKVSLEIGSEKVSRVSFSVEDESLEYWIIYGPDPKTILQRYTALTGRPALPPAWSFGLWLSTSFTTDYNEKTVNHFLDGMEELKIPVSVFHFDCFWMKAYTWTDFTWDPDCFPDPEAMLSRLKVRGLKICAWINPYIAQNSDVFDEISKKGYLLEADTGGIWQTDLWQAGMGILDFTNPAAKEWYQGKIRELLKMGIDALKTDFAERIPLNVHYFNKAEPRRMHNLYTYLYNQAVFEVICEEKGRDEAILFARSATTGGQKFPVHWGGDCLASYDSMAESLRGGLSLCSSGFSFWSHDISGFESTATPDLYKRWSAFGLLSTHSRLHGSGSYRVPWHFDNESSDVLRHFTLLKAHLMPYLYSWAAYATETGIPLMRPMIVEFPKDPNCRYLDRQYLLGPNLLVAPIFEEEGHAEFYVPEDIWTDLQSGKTYDGPGWFYETYDYFGLPLLVRPGAILPMNRTATGPAYDYTEKPEIRIYNPKKGVYKQPLVDERGQRKGGIEVEKTAEEIRISWKNLDHPEFLLFTDKVISEEGCIPGRIPGSYLIRPLGNARKGSLSVSCK